MNNLFRRSLLLPAALILLLSMTFIQRANAQEYDDNAQNAPISMQTFYDDLAPYGQWVEDAQYGYVWVPNVDNTFRPYYTNGYWVMTEYGNTWVSDYPWGWAAFHYGRWTYDSYYGWIWLPGTTWGPAWVSWRESDSYYGWAPLGPGITVSASWGGGYYCPDNWWTFIPPQYIYRHNYYHYWYGPDNNHVIINNTRVINNTYVNDHDHNTYVSGPRAEEVERFTNQPVKVYHLASSSSVRTTSVNKTGTVTMYHPMQVKTTTQYGDRPQPAVVTRAPQPVTRTPQSPGGSNAPAFRQQQTQEPRNTPAVAPVRTPVQTEPQRYEYNPQTARPQNNVPQTIDREPQVQRSAPAPQNVERAQPQPQPAARPAQQNFQRAQPAPQPAPRQAPVMQRPSTPAPAPQRENGRR